MKKFLTLTIIAIIALIGLSVSVNAADVATEADLKNAVLTDGTVKLTGDIEITESIITTTDVTVDLNGFKITGPDDGVANWYAFIIKDGTFTLKDSSVAQTGEIYAKCYGVETKGGTFIMESGKITATKNAGIGAAVVNYGGKVEIRGGTLVASYSAVDCQSYFTDAEVVISGGTFETIVDSEATIDIGGKYSNGTETATISGGTFKGINTFAVNTNADVSITGGKFESDISEYLPENAKVEKDENGNFNVVKLHTITVMKTENGKVTASADKASKGEIIKLIVTPDEGYKLKTLVMESAAGSTPIDITETKEFEMIDFAAIVFAEFEKAEESTAGGQGTAEQQPAKGEKDETPETGSVDIVLLVSAMVAIISVAGIVAVKKYTR